MAEQYRPQPNDIDIVDTPETQEQELLPSFDEQRHALQDIRTLLKEIFRANHGPEEKYVNYIDELERWSRNKYEDGKWSQEEVLAEEKKYTRNYVNILFEIYKYLKEKMTGEGADLDERERLKPLDDLVTYLQYAAEFALYPERHKDMIANFDFKDYLERTLVALRSEKFTVLYPTIARYGFRLPVREPEDVSLPARTPAVLPGKTAASNTTQPSSLSDNRGGKDTKQDGQKEGHPSESNSTEEKQEKKAGDETLEQTPEGLFAGFDGQENQKERIGSIETEDHSLYQSLFIRDVNTPNPDGSIRQLVLRFDPVSCGDLSVGRSWMETDITIPLSRIRFNDIAKLPLPLGYEVIGLSDSSVNLERSELGTYRVTGLSEGVETITYRIRKAKNSETVIQPSSDWLNEFPVAHLTATTKLADEIIKNTEDIKKKVVYIASGVRSLEPIYTILKEIGDIYRAARDRVQQAIEAMDAIGLCATSSVYVMNRMRKHGIPAALIQGETLERDARSFKGPSGHMQVLYLDERGIPQTFEATSVNSKSLTIDKSSLDIDALQKITEQIPSMDDRELFDTLQQLAKDIKAKAKPVDMSVQQPESLPEWAYHSEVMPLENSTDTGDFFKALVFEEKWRDRDLNALDLEGIQAYLTERSTVNYYNARHYLTYEMKLTMEEAAEKYPMLYQTSSYGHLMEMMHEKLDQLKDSAPAAVERAHVWLYAESMRIRRKRNEGKTPAVEMIDVLDILPLEYLESLLTPSDRMQYCVTALHELAGYLYEKFSPFRMAQFRNALRKLVSLSRTARDYYQSHPDEIRPWIKFFNDQNLNDNGIAYTLAYEIGQRGQAGQIEVEKAKILGNLIMSFEKPQEIVAELVMQPSTNNEEIHAWGNLLLSLAFSGTMPRLIDGVSNATPELEKAVHDYFYSRWLPDAGLKTALTKAFLNYLEGYLQLDIRLLTDHPHWQLDAVLKRDKIELNFPDSEEAPVSYLLNAYSQGGYKLPGMAMARTINILDRDVDNSLIDAVAQEWPSHDERQIFEKHMANGNVVWDKRRGRLILRDPNGIGAAQSDSWGQGYNIPLIVSPRFENDQLSKTKFLKDLTIKNAKNEDPRLANAWSQLQDSMPDLYASVENKIETSKDTERYIQAMVAEQYLTITERYEIRQFVALLTSDQLLTHERMQRLGQLAELLVDIQDSRDGSISEALEKVFVGDALIPILRAWLLKVPLEKRHTTLLFLGQIADEYDRSQGPTNNVWRRIGDDQYDYLSGGFYFSSLDSAVSHIGIRSHRKLVDEDASSAANLFDSLLLENNDAANDIPLNLEGAWRQILSATLERKPESGPAPRFARFLSDVLGRETKILSGGGLKLESRAYQPGDDIKNIDWNANARTGELYTKMPNEQQINPVYCVVDGDWLAEGARGNIELPQNLRYLMTLLALGAKERIPVHMQVYWRGEKLFSYEGKGQDSINQMFRAENHDKAKAMMWRLWRLSVAAYNVNESEAKQGIEYPATRIMREAWAPPKPSTIAPLIARRNLSASMGLIAAMARR